MRTITITKNLYKFNELSETAREKALEKLGDINTDHEWWDPIYEDAENIGVKITAFDTDRVCRGAFTRDAEYTANAILREHGDKGETNKDASQYLKDRSAILAKPGAVDENGDTTFETEKTIDDLDAEFLRTLLEDYRIMLRSEYEYLTSEKAVAETIEANEYEFDENGSLA